MKNLMNTKLFSQREFLTEVIAQGNSPKNQGRKIAIIGEPGAGKTTQLQTIADWIFAQTEDVAIWISLADLHEKSIKEYLLKVWLENALNVKRVTPDLEDALVKLFNQGRVWLLLDGVDEMGVKNPLQFINSQISGWVASARIILTCRLNVWDVGKNYLESFDAYRNLDFDSEQVKEFIGKWFIKNSELGEDLQNELEKSGKERIRDLIKNPLRLTLLCWFWQRRQGSFPETKAGLYKRFVEVFYEWKEWEADCFVTQSEAKKKLEGALGELAVKAIDKNSSRFRLTHREVCQVLGDVDTPLFKLVMKLGWLNKLGVAEENPDEEVYAFFHPTFQEYFAALAISEWDFFLNHNNENPNPFLKHNGKDCVYRIFESHWQEVLLLWLGRDDVEDKKKDELMLNLVEFKDGFQNFYSKNSNLLHIANEARGEFRKCFLNTMHWWYVDDDGPDFWEEFNNYASKLTGEPYWHPNDRNLRFSLYFDHFTDSFSWSEVQKRLGTYMYKIRDKQVENFKKELKIRAENEKKELKNLEDSFLSRFGIIPEFKGLKVGNSEPSFTTESINTILQFTDLQSIQADLSKYGFLEYSSPAIMIVISALDKDKELISESKDI